MLDGLQYEIVPAEPGDTKGASFFAICEPPQASLAHLASSETARRELAENYIGLPF